MKKTKGQRLIHKILILDATLSEPLTNKNYRSFVTSSIEDLMKLLNMKPLGPLSIFVAEDKSEPGWSFIQPITTSHISGHYFSKLDPLPHIHLDIYSCKDFDWKKVLKFFHKRLPLDSCAGTIVLRTISNKRKVTTFYKSYR